ncbi:MAG: hypothetical protein PHR83_06640 [Paludibacter sp.]|nr:hypothetical protein [Paludibacter sp.]
MENIQLKNHSGENEVAKTTNVASRKKRKRDESPYLKIRSKAANIFRNQIDKSVKTKKMSIERALDKVISGDYTKSRFLAEFRANVDMLLDSKRFEKDCKQHKLKPFNAATHIVFDGASKIELVLKNGLYPNYSTRLTELVEPLFTEEDLQKASTVISTQAETVDD